MNKNIQNSNTMQEKNEKKYVFSERLKQVIECLGVTVKELSRKLGYPRPQTLYDYLNGRVLPSFDFFFRLILADVSENINVEWLISGKGNMLKNEISDKENDKNEKIFKEPKSEYSTNIIKEKDKRIEDLLGQIEFLKKLIEEKI